MGFCNLPVGLGGAVILVTVPQLLAAQNVPETSIAWITTLGLTGTFINFLLAPVLDWRLTRRAYAVITALLTGVLSFAVLAWSGSLVALAAIVLVLGLVINLNVAAVGGWLSQVVDADRQGVLSASLSIANIVGFGVGAAVTILLVRFLPPIVGPAAVALLELLPIPLCLAIPATPPDRKLAHESFAAFSRDVLTLLRQPTVRFLFFFLVMPAASFALSNTLTGLGKDFGASEELVGAVSGIGVAIAGVVGCSVVPPLLRLMPPARLYLWLGAGGAVLTLVQLALPRTPLSLAFGIIEQNAIQATALTVITALVLRSNGGNNPLAATQYSLLFAATGLPLTYMQLIDGQAYGIGALAGSYLADAFISLAACAILAVLLRQRAGVFLPAGSYEAERA
ncbi:MAG TPA: MFS transporter [Stellaceae bacterium]|nr:MFS transporter [Stellaceae bacterium]